MLLRRRLALAAVLTLSAGAAQAQTIDPSFRLTNNSAVAIHEIYVSSSQVDTWGADRLGQNILPSGQSYIIRLPAGQCVNDIRAVFANGEALERRQVNT